MMRGRTSDTKVDFFSFPIFSYDGLFSLPILFSSLGLLSWTLTYYSFHIFYFHIFLSLFAPLRSFLRGESVRVL
jgi:hypothetical protein